MRAPVPAEVSARLRTAVEDARRGGSPREWMRAHVRDSLRFGPDDCAAAVSADSTPDYALHYEAGFREPAPPPTLELPADADSAALRLDQCRLAHVLVDVTARDTASARSIFREATAVLDRALGAGARTVAMQRDGSRADTSLVRHWSGAAGAAAITYRPPSATQPPRVSVFVYAPGVPLPRHAGWDPPFVAADVAVERAEDRALLDSALRVAALDGDDAAAVAEAVRSLPADSTAARVRYTDLDDSVAVATDRRLLPALRALVAPRESRGTRRTAAALVAADRLLVLSLRDRLDKERPTDATTLRELHALGARFGHNHWVPSEDYRASWLARARRLDPDGPFAGVATVILIERLEAAACRESDDDPAFETVEGLEHQIAIARGLEALPRYADRAVRGRLHLALGNAYADVPALIDPTNEYGVSRTDANGEPDTAFKRLEREAPAARREAVAHYRAAIAHLDPRSDRARGAWRRAWSMLAGFTPAITYGCTTD